MAKSIAKDNEVDPDHETNPVEIELALKNNYINDVHMRDLQPEVNAHIALQKWIDSGECTERTTTAIATRWMTGLFWAQRG